MDPTAENPNGSLIMAANSIGNSEDFPKRSQDMLRLADLLVFEEDRPARLALKTAQIHRPYLKFNEHHQQETLDQVRHSLKSGQTVVYMSDQGMPGIADPGHQLLEIAYALEAQVKIIPGPSSILAALAACPFAINNYVYRGFLPRKVDELVRYLQDMTADPRPSVILDAPYRRHQLLQACREAWGAKRQVLLAVDITGDHERYFWGTLAQVGDQSADLDKKTNFVLVVRGLKSPPQ